MFNGIITESKFVIFNDETFVPTDKAGYVYPLEDNYTFIKNFAVSMDIKIFYDPTSSLNNGDKVDIIQRLELDDTDMILTFTLVMKKEM